MVMVTGTIQSLVGCYFFGTASIQPLHDAQYLRDAMQQGSYG